MAELYAPTNPVRFVTASSLFDGHDAAINVMRRVLQSQGAEVIHLGHDRSVHEVAVAALQEDVQGVAISSYQGGHVEYFSYLAEHLREVGAGHVRVFGGGGGVIVPEEIALLRDRGVTIFSPEDGQRLGLPGMINTLIEACDVDLTQQPAEVADLLSGGTGALARTITLLERGGDPALVAELTKAAASRQVPVLGITGTGGSGKSSLTDELLRRFRAHSGDKLRIAVLAVDPSRRRGGGALLGDRIRMNALDGGERTVFRSLATRTPGAALPEHIDDVITACKAWGADLVILETPGMGQGDAAVVSHCDTALYVMTPEYGASSQLEKIDMLDFADVVAVNKYERRGGEDARRDVARQLVRNREAFGASWESMPVFGTSAARFRDDGVDALFAELTRLLAAHGLQTETEDEPTTHVSTKLQPIVPPSRAGYLGAIAETVRGYHRETAALRDAARTRQHLGTALDLAPGAADLAPLRAAAEERLPAPLLAELDGWEQTRATYAAEELDGQPLHRTTLSGTEVPRVALPRTTDHGELVRYLRGENLPGRFPYTAAVFPLRRQGEAPARMFAGEGDAFRTNRRFRLLSEGLSTTRLSTAFDSVTLYGRDPATRPDIYGKVGTSGVSIATLDDMRELYRGFDLNSPTTSVSMTINGPAPTLLAMFFTVAVEQALEARPDDDPAVVRAEALQHVRGTVQADILKEDQGQNTCLFSTEFSLRCMADMQEWFVQHDVRGFYSVSISGYHIAEAGANPLSQLAFTLSNAFTYVEAYLARGMAVDDFAHNLSFFFSNGMDAEYTVLGRVARRIWAVAMRDRYGASPRSQKLKYHVQTSGRSLHAQEMSYNDIRTTLQALCALYDNANSLHTNAFDEAVTTPSAASVRRALAIQQIIDQEWGLSMNENPLQGSYVVEELTDLVEAAVLAEFDRLDERGGVLGAMETGYQRGRIQDESMLYEQRKHDGSLPIIGVNTALAPPSDEPPHEVELARATEAEKQSQLDRLAAFHEAHRLQSGPALARLREVASTGGNVFGELMAAVQVCSLGEITAAFLEVGGQFRRTV